MRVVSIDPSLRSLGMFFMEDGEFNSSVLQHSIRDFPDRIEIYRKMCLRFARESSLGWDLLIVEGYSMAEKSSSSVTGQAEIGGLIRGLFAARNVPIVEVQIPTWQSVTKTTLKKGNSMATSDYLNDVVRKFGIRFKTTDEADAFLIYETVRLCGIRTWKSGTGPANIKARLEELRIDTSKWPETYGKVEEKDRI